MHARVCTLYKCVYLLAALKLFTNSHSFHIWYLNVYGEFQKLCLMLLLGYTITRSYAWSISAKWKKRKNSYENMLIYIEHSKSEQSLHR